MTGLNPKSLDHWMSAAPKIQAMQTLFFVTFSPFVKQKLDLNFSNQMQCQMCHALLCHALLPLHRFFNFFFQ
jgi:hypothetical protein